MHNDLISFLQKTGKVKHILTESINKDVFSDLSKHSPTWQSNDIKFGVMLDEIRLTLQDLEQNIIDCLNLLTIDDDQDD